ncbi:GNAT family N-acetyltransferase [Arenimonas fontis]|uniref:GNAT family N-acetyltransferase n=1 Tax=Arenimonas fontis TaxID=2608255 RepID=A0A5B2ZBL1_9GAMM|nr:GNAT family protein [Arenimonas fontis]KAA2284532.1 GNAT family N-acetyltransferase [Arenimonas fontis]
MDRDCWQAVPTLVGRHVRLEPLQAKHADALAAAAGDGELWRLWYTSVPSPDTVHDYIGKALADQAAGTAMPFVVKDAAGAVVGSTRFFMIDRDVPRLELGYTWYARRAQRTALNTEAKRLLLGHAFEVLGCAVVELRTHVFNHSSRRAIERLGAHFDGILRRNMRMPDGDLRDTAVYSILDSEWPTVRKHLDFKLAGGMTP